MTDDPVRLAKVLGGADTAWLVARVRERMARGLSLTESVSLRDPTAAERAAVDRLLGRRPSSGATVSVPLAKLDAVLRESGIHSDGLAAAAIALGGPVANRAEAEARVEQAWSDALEPMWTYANERPELLDWWGETVRTGLVRRLTSTPDIAGPLVRQLRSVLAALPAERKLLGQLAAQVLDSAHALDAGTPLSTLATGAARTLGGIPEGADRRTVWAAVGVVVDELSSTVLTVGFPGDARTSTGRALQAWRAAGQPVVLTLRQLMLDPPVLYSDEPISICENPAVVAAAAGRHGPDCLPLVCTGGQPGGAVLTLLELAVAADARLRYHGDFDWYGIGIANFLHRRFVWTPWRFGAAEYARAAAVASTRPLTGKPTAARWDAELCDTMRHYDRQVEEELVIDDLLADLRR
ncbi:TIGR02679 family protein [Nocardia pseudovaccinii]|uniref:TIGR02679 family protein n=1 Tax=Nocardia pseudovaccinii TaxID=189540 RepID=UPI003D8A8C0B